MGLHPHLLLPIIFDGKLASTYINMLSSPERLSATLYLTFQGYTYQFNGLKSVLVICIWPIKSVHYEPDLNFLLLFFFFQSNFSAIKKNTSFCIYGLFWISHCNIRCNKSWFWHLSHITEQKETREQISYCQKTNHFSFQSYRHAITIQD